MPSLSSVVESFLLFSSNLTPVQLWFVYAIMFVLLLYLAYRTMGIGGFIGVLILGFFAFILFDQDILKRYREKEKNEASRMEQLEKELKKSDAVD